MIPRLLQLHWMFSDPPPIVDVVHRRWKAALPGWDILMLTKIPGDFPPAFRKFMDEPRIPARNRMDLFRNWSLWRYGGIYVDMDALPVSPFDDSLLKAGCFVPACSHPGSPNGSYFIDSCFLGSVPFHPFWRTVWDNCMHPEEWPHPGQWFCGINTFRGLDRHGVSVIHGGCREATGDDTRLFLEDPAVFVPAPGDEYIMHFRLDMGRQPRTTADQFPGRLAVKRPVGLSPTWRDVYGKYPCEEDVTIPARTYHLRNRITWGPRKSVRHGTQPINPKEDPQ